MPLDVVQAVGLAYMALTTAFGVWQFRQNRRHDDTVKSRQTRDDLVILLQTKLGFAEHEIELLKVKVQAQGAQLDILTKLPFDSLRAEHAAILGKLGEDVKLGTLRLHFH